MDQEDVRRYCLRKRGKITEEFPFDEEVLVYKVHGKIFLLTNVDELPLSMNLKCDPERAVELRERYAAVRPGYHMHKKYWNTVTADGTVPDDVLYGLIDHSYDEVVKGLPAAVRKGLESGRTPQSRNSHETPKRTLRS